MKTKHLLLFFCALLAGLAAQAQTVFTNTLVFNYSVGDTFVYQGGNGASGVVLMKVITSKLYSANGDTVKYGSFIFQRVSSAGPQGVQTMTNTFTQVEAITDLNDTLIPSTHFPVDSMYGERDSIYVAYCGLRTLKASSYPINNNFETNSWECSYSVGLGKTYNYEYIATALPPYSGWLQLIYHHKVGSPACGDRSPLTVGIRENSLLQTDVKLYPNPTTDRLYLAAPELTLKSIQLADQLGRLYQLPGDGSSVNLQGLPAGVYCLTAINDKPVNFRKIIKLDEMN